MDALTLGATDLSRFEAFSIISVGYKMVSSHTITVDVLYPKSLNDPSQDYILFVPRPVLLRYHGGGLIAGYSLFPPFFSPWYLELAQEHLAIIVSPNYRLPAGGFFAGTRKNGTVKADLSRIITIGDSVGGYLSLHMGLSHPDEIRAVNAVYAMVNPKAPYFSSGQERPVFNLPAYPPDTMGLHLGKIKRQEAITQQPVIVSAAADADRIRLMFAACQHGQLGQLFPTDPVSPYLLERIDAGARFPRSGVLMLHGRDDSVAPVEESYVLRRKLAQVDPSLNFRLVVRDGEHGFDHLAKLHDVWLWDAIQDIVRSWLD
ncbi:alpha/beta-hydrolase [Aspergillus transmontanensis]|uniref:Alpha/beta-hydrolase n=1 Tax=Aspergillus transmontanensis TaxID=1034304 RepID=A0A5N6WE51_9EURO|nr:alpha/beta-hydrolase [Aspergillus transmontanensis]